jgi:hypothetical protein
MPKPKTTISVNGGAPFDATRLLSDLESKAREQDKAVETLAYLLRENFMAAEATSSEGAFAMAFSVTFNRLAGRTAIKVKCSYSKKFTAELEGFAQHQQGDLFDRIDDDE